MTSTRWLTLVALLSVPLSARAETRQERAQKHFQEARALLAQGRCTRRGCPDFAAGAAKLRAAWDLHPKLDYASYYCRAHAMAWKVEKLGGRGELVALAMCDAAWVFHEDRSRRSQGGGHARAIRRARFRGGRASDPVAAVKALYGIGLRMTEVDGSANLAYADVDARALHRFVRDYYYPYAAGKGLKTTALMKPREKVKLCKSIAGWVPSSRRSEIEQLCEYRAALEANRVRHSFAGLRPVSFTPGKPLYAVKSNLRYTVHVSIAGSTPINSEASFGDLINLINDIEKRGKHHRFYREAMALKVEMEDAQIRLQKQVARAERRLGRRNRVVFYPAWPDRYRLPEPLEKHADSCESVTARVYARRGYTDATTEVDGQRCASDLGGRKLTLTPSKQRGCRARLLAPGRHTVRITAYSTRWRKTGKRLKVHRSGRVDVRDTESYRRGRRIARASITCGK